MPVPSRGMGTVVRGREGDSRVLRKERNLGILVVAGLGTISGGMYWGGVGWGGVGWGGVGWDGVE